MNPVLSVCVAMVLTLSIMETSVAQGHGRHSPRCEPDALHCQMASGSYGRSGPMLLHPKHSQKWFNDARRGDHNERSEDHKRGWNVEDLRRGDRLPPTYRGYQYVIEDWRGHGLGRPPSGHHWVQVGADYVLVAVATGIVLELLLSH